MGRAHVSLRVLHVGEGGVPPCGGGRSTTMYAHNLSGQCMAFDSFNIQWNLSITDTLGTKKEFIVHSEYIIQRFPLFRGYLICTAIYLVPPKQSVIERFSLLREFVKRGSTVYCFSKQELHNILSDLSITNYSMQDR